MAYDRVIVWECLFVALMVLLFMMGIIVPFPLRYQSCQQTYPHSP